METRSNYVMVGAVTVALLAGVLLFIVWLAGLSNKQTKCYDIYFAQGVGGLNKGSTITFSGVPVGQIERISLLPNRPEFVWVRITVDQQTPVLQGTTAQIKGVGFTGVSEIQLDGAARGAPPITQVGPQGCPVIPSATGGLGALLEQGGVQVDLDLELAGRGLLQLVLEHGQHLGVPVAGYGGRRDAQRDRIGRARAAGGQSERQRAKRDCRGEQASAPEDGLHGSGSLILSVTRTRRGAPIGAHDATARAPAQVDGSWRAMPASTDEKSFGSTLA